MDNKTWSNLTGNVRSLQVLQQHQLLSSNVTGNIYPGSVSNQPGTPWQQRVACCNALSGASTPQSQLLSHQQQPQQNQVQQSPQLRYYQISSPNSSASLHNQSQHHFAQQYTLITCPSSISSSASSQIVDRSSKHKQCETLYSGCYLSNQFQSPRKILKSCEESNPHSHNLNNRDLSNQPLTFQSLLALNGSYQPRYKIVSSSHFGLPSSGEQLTSTAYLTFGSSRKTTSGTEASPRFVEGAALIPKIIPSFPGGSLPGFVNAIDALPDMLEGVRPGTTSSTSKLGLAPLLFSDEEFSYHVSKPQLTIRLESVVVATVQSIREKNWQLLSSHRSSSISKILQPAIASVSERPDKLWKKLYDDKSLRGNTRKSVKITSSRKKTYAAAVQLSGREDIRSRRDTIIMSQSMTSRLRLQESRIVNTIVYPPDFHTSMPKMIEGRHQKRAYDSSCDEEYEFSPSSTISSSTLSRTSERCSSPETIATLTNCRKISLSLQEEERNEEKITEDNSLSDAPSRKKLCKMAESFCFGQLENAAFFRAFDEYNRRRRRMAYTEKLQTHETKTTCASFFGETPIQRQPEEIFGKQISSHTGELYTNSWRPEEVHFYHQYYTNNNI